MSKESEIKHLIRDIAAPNGGAALFEAEVVESKDTECTIKYQGLLHKNVRLVCGFSQSLTTIKSQMFHPYENIKSPIHKYDVKYISNIYIFYVKQFITYYINILFFTFLLFI